MFFDVSLPKIIAEYYRSSPGTDAEKITLTQGYLENYLDNLRFAGVSIDDKIIRIIRDNISVNIDTSFLDKYKDS